MQLMKYWTFSLAMCFSFGMQGQNALPDTTAKEPVEIDFLISYYDQDGNHSPVTGGLGTEKLTDVAPKIMVTVPLNEKTKLSVDLGLEAYSSASTDQIDPSMSGNQNQTPENI